MINGKRFGLQKTTLADYPGEVASTIFTTGCNMKCPYCHNADLAAGEIPAAFSSLETIFEFITKRSNVLGGVCITGGEPLLEPELKTIIDKIHALGLKVKLDTNGTLPNKLKELNPDYIAMDVKTSLSRYGELGYHSSTAEKNIKASIDYIISSGIEHEFRTTTVPGLVNKEEVQEFAKLLIGCDKYVLAKFNPEHTLNPNWQEKTSYTPQEMRELADITTKAGINTQLRGVPALTD